MMLQAAVWSLSIKNHRYIFCSVKNNFHPKSVQKLQVRGELLAHCLMKVDLISRLI